MPKPKAQGGKKVKEENVVNDDKNWRLRIKDETEAQRHFESEWGFLLPDYDSRSEATRGPIEVKKENGGLSCQDINECPTAMQTVDSCMCERCWCKSEHQPGADATFTCHEVSLFL